MILLQTEPIDVATLIAGAQRPEAGAVVLFLGVTREFTGQRQTAELSYEAYGQMAKRELARLEGEARERWGLVDCYLVHRLGRVPLGEPSVAVIATSPHRDAAFDAARWLIDTLKESVPIWKQEQYADGSSEWVHPAPELGPGRNASEGAADPPNL